VQCRKRVAPHQSNILPHHTFLFDQKPQSSITTIQQTKNRQNNFKNINPSFPYLERVTKGDFGHEQMCATVPKMKTVEQGQITTVIPSGKTQVQLANEVYG